MSSIVVTFVLDAALRSMSRCAQAAYQLLMRSCCSLRLPGGVRQAAGGVTQVGLADSGCAFCVGLPCCSEQSTRDGTPEPGARSPLGKGEWDSLSEKDLYQEDANGEKLTVKKYGGFLVPIFHGLRGVFHGL